MAVCALPWALGQDGGGPSSELQTNGAPLCVSLEHLIQQPLLDRHSLWALGSSAGGPLRPHFLAPGRGQCPLHAPPFTWHGLGSGWPVLGAWPGSSGVLLVSCTLSHHSQQGGGVPETWSTCSCPLSCPVFAP